MAVKQYYHDIDQLNVGQLIGSRVQNISTSSRTGLSLSADNKGLMVWDTDLNTLFIWSGSSWVEWSANVIGDVVFRGVIDAGDFDEALPNVEAGSQYIAGGAGTLAFTNTAFTYTPNATVEEGDMFIVTSASTIHVIQRNIDQATDSVAGIVKLADNATTTAGSDATTAVTPASLEENLNSKSYTKQYTVEVDLVAGTPKNVAHNLNLQDQDAFVINTTINNEVISLDVDSVDEDNLTVTSLVALSGVRVTVIGAEDNS